MKKITVKELIKSRGKKLVDVAAETGLSISMISKLKNGRIAVTQETKKVFEKKYDVQIIEVNDYALLRKNLDELENQVESKNETICDLNKTLIKLKETNEKKRQITELLLLPNSFWDRNDVEKVFGKLLKLQKMWELEKNK